MINIFYGKRASQDKKMLHKKNWQTQSPSISLIYKVSYWYPSLHKGSSEIVFFVLKNYFYFDALSADSMQQMLDILYMILFLQ